MMFELIRLDAENVESLFRVRSDSLQVCVDDPFVWVRARNKDDDAEAILSTLPGLPYRSLPEDAEGRLPLAAAGNRLATAWLTNPSWIAVSDWIAVQVPTPAWPPAVMPKSSLKLGPGNQMTAASALVTSIDNLRRFVDSTLELRLKPLTFAMNSSGEAFVKGSPLPPISGTRFCIHNGIAIPAGQTWAPAVDADSLRAAFGNPAGIVLWTEDDHWDIIDHDSFTAVTRAAVRASADAVPDRIEYSAGGDG